MHESPGATRRSTLPQILERLARTGYRAHPLDAATLDDVRRRESRDALKRLLVAGFGAMQAMMFAAVLYLGSSDLSANELFRWLGFLVATPVVFYSARPFFAGALRSLKARQLGMDVPVAAAVALIYAASLIEAVRGGGHVYFDSVSMFVFFLLAGRYLQMRARHRAGDLTDALARLTPPFADRWRADGALERVGIQELAVGDRVHVEEGGRLPADGVLLSERCRVDEALLSGESAPLTKRRGEPLIAGSVLLDGPIHMRVDRVGAETMLAGIAASGGARASAASATGTRRRTRRSQLRCACAGADGADGRGVERRRSVSRILRCAGCAGRVVSVRICIGRSCGHHSRTRGARALRRPGRQAGCDSGAGRGDARRVRQDGHAHRTRACARRRGDIRWRVA